MNDPKENTQTPARAGIRERVARVQLELDIGTGQHPRELRIVALDVAGNHEANANTWRVSIEIGAQTLSYANLSPAQARAVAHALLAAVEDAPPPPPRVAAAPIVRLRSSHREPPHRPGVPRGKVAP
jgi:hypothetical protein